MHSQLSPAEARKRHAAGEISDERLRALEDEAITTAVRRQAEAGIDVITDGEFRRGVARNGAPGANL